MWLVWRREICVSDTLERGRSTVDELSSEIGDKETFPVGVSEEVDCIAG